MGAGNSKEEKDDTINWNNLRTENISSTRSNLNNVNNDAVKLVLNLNYPEISENSEFNTKYLISKNSNFTENNNLNITENDNNSTSAFISSEMYKYIVDKYQNQGPNNQNQNQVSYNKQMIGGAKNNYSDDSSTSSTSSSKLSSSDSSSESSETEQQKKEKKEKKNKKPIKGGRKTKKSVQNKKKKNSKFTEDELSYISSSAHTISANSISENSISNENSVSISSSVRTSQINLISE